MQIRALEWSRPPRQRISLAQAEREHAVGFTFVHVDPRLEALRDDSRFAYLLLKTIGLFPSQEESTLECAVRGNGALGSGMRERLNYCGACPGVGNAPTSSAGPPPIWPTPTRTRLLVLPR
jgi:hypothetical protein